MRGRSRLIVVALLATVAGASAQAAPDTDDWQQAFQHPPAAARPHVWWHWMNGNVDADGARRDLAWMASIGITEAHVFEGGMGTPTVIPQRRPFMSPGWQDALKASVETASALHMTLGLATSPGWSAAGGPWVQPTDAMKKLVWSELEVEGGQPLRTILPHPPAVAGPYQDVALSLIQPDQHDAPVFYRDIRVLAIPVGASKLPIPRVSATGDAQLTVDQLTNHQFADASTVPLVDGAAWVCYRFPAPQTVRGITVGVPSPSGFGSPNPPLATLEASDDGRIWRKVVELPPTPTPALASPARTASFAPITAQWFRLRLTTDATPAFIEQFHFAPGALKPPHPSQPTGFPLSEFALSAVPIVSRAPEKAGFSTLGDYYAAADAPGAGIDPADVIDVTAHMAQDGTLIWAPPVGRWRIIRLGWSLTGHHNGPAPDEATGLEVDKLSAPRVAVYMEHYLGLYRQVLGPKAFGPGGFASLLSDSIEAGPQNWTESLPDEFTRRRGYDPAPWLPALTGQIIGDTTRTDAFLYDWRRTIADLYSDAFYGTIARVAHDHGLTYSAEALEDHRPQLGDDMAMRAHADVPMGAMWTVDSGGKPSPTYVADIKGAASVSNLYDRRVVAAESMSAFGRPWAFAPVDLKPTVDLEFALGVNRIHIHESAHQPLADQAPGLALATFLGQYFNRNETWAPMADGWITYLARSSSLLQQGHHVADIAYFHGEEAPLTSLYGDGPVPDVPAGYDYDFVDAEALATRLSVVDGHLATPGGETYRVLYLGGDSQHMTLATLRRIGELVTAGATVVGKRPVGSPSLADDPIQVSAAIDRLWDQGAVSHVHDDLTTVPRTIPADWIWHATKSDQNDLTVIHRASPGKDMWFISNRSGRGLVGTIDVRIAGRAPQLWHADTGRIEAISYTTSQGRTRVPLALLRDDAVFLVFTVPTNAPALIVPTRSTRILARLDGGWRIALQPGHGAPTSSRATRLTDWSKNPDPRIRYFSGIGTYRRTLALPRKWPAVKGDITLDLGQVKDVADVWINGRRAGVVWKPPYAVDVTGMLRPGTNRIAIRVANLWVNRLIGDAQPGAHRIAFVTGPTYAANAPLRSSGLLGPIRLMATDLQTRYQLNVPRAK